MVVNRCCVMYCKNTPNSLLPSPAKFFCLPKDAGRATIWLSSINRLDLLENHLAKPFENLVCSDHFDPETLHIFPLPDHVIPRLNLNDINNAISDISRPETYRLPSTEPGPSVSSLSEITAPSVSSLSEITATSLTLSHLANDTAIPETDSSLMQPEDQETQVDYGKIMETVYVNKKLKITRTKNKAVQTDDQCFCNSLN